MHNFKSVPQIFPIGQWATNNSINKKVTRYDGRIYGIRCDWNHSITIRNDDYESNQEPKSTK